MSWPKRAVTYVGYILTLWAFLGIVSFLFYGSEQTDVVVVNESAGWAYLGTVNKSGGFNFEPIDDTSPLISAGSTLRAVRGVNLRANYFSPLWWIPYIGRRRILGQVSEGEAVCVVDVRSVIKVRIWLLVTRNLDHCSG